MRQLITCKFVVASVVFLTLSAFAGAVGACRLDPATFAYRSWTAWAIEDFLNRPKAPQVVFLGSSLMLVPLDGIDADFMDKRLDGSQHHRSVYFEEKYRSLTGQRTTSFNFALPGEMPSDAYMIVDFLLKGQRKPNMIVYGVGPRDFMDNLLPSPAATDPFRFLSRFGELDPHASLMMPDWIERMNYELGKLVYMYGKRADICLSAEKKADKLVWNLIPNSVPQMPTFERRRLVPDYRPYELGVGEAFFRPAREAGPVQFVDNLAEYRKRYKKLKWDTFLTQMKFFAETLGIAQSRGTHAVVVAMPITDLNRSLLSDLSWRAYLSSIKSVAISKGATFIDLSESKQFNRGDFGDTVHLHAQGGRKFMDVVIDSLSESSTVRKALARNSGDSVAARGRPQL